MRRRTNVAHLLMPNSTLTYRDKIRIRQAQSPVSISKLRCGLGKLLPELILVKRAQGSHNHTDRCRDISQVP
jgi:hypothetical protein